MRPRIEALDVDAMEWAPLGAEGLYSKMLSRDEATGARTALQRMDPGYNYTPPKIAHYHHTYEEILAVSGHFSFDSRTYLNRGGYVFHPPLTVHGFKSDVPVESHFLSRVGRDLDFNYVPEPPQDEYYLVGEPMSSRDPVGYVNPIEALGLEDTTFLGGAAKTCVLSAEPNGGEGTSLFVLPAGWQSTVEVLPNYLEMFVVEGGLAVEGGEPGPRHSYFFYPPEDKISALSTKEETLLYVNYGAKI